MFRLAALLILCLALPLLPSSFVSVQAPGYSLLYSPHQTFQHWTEFGSQYATKVTLEVLNKADARASASGSSVSLWAYSVAWAGGAGAIAIVSQGTPYTAPVTGTYALNFNYEVAGYASTMGANPSFLVGAAESLILGSMEKAIETAVKPVISRVFKDLLHARNVGTHAALAFAIGDSVFSYPVYSKEDWVGDIWKGWQPESIKALVSGSPTVYLEAGRTYDVSAVLTVWTADGASLVQTVGSLIQLSGPGLISVSIQPQCYGGQSWNGQQCVCPLGQEWNGQQCVQKTPTCPDGQYWTGSLCACPSGQDWNGQQCVTPKPTCPDGQYWTGSHCACPGGWEWNGQQCIQPPPPPSNECGGPIVSMEGGGIAVFSIMPQIPLNNVQVWAFPISFLGQDPTTQIPTQYDVGATIAVTYCQNGNSQQQNLRTPFSLWADQGTPITLNVLSPSGFACTWDHYGYRQHQTCTLTIQVGQDDKIVAYFNTQLLMIMPVFGALQIQLLDNSVLGNPYQSLISRSPELGPSAGSFTKRMYSADWLCR